MPRLVLLNGAPATGKSTVARIYAAEHPGTLALDVDVVRGMLGDWEADPHAAGLAARRLALAMAREHLASGADVVVPQLVARPDFAEQLEALAADVGASWHEVVLTVGDDEMVERFARRSAVGERPEDRDARRLVERDGGEPALVAARERLDELVRNRPRAVVVATDGLDLDEVGARVVEAIA